MTLGSEGSVGLDVDGYWEIQAVKLEKVVNSAGAGDGFLAATVARLLWGCDLRSAIDWASKYAALSVTIHGTIPAYRPLAEVEAFIAKLESQR
jgi:ribokinase